MHKKYIFVDLDGTILSHSTNKVPDSTKEAIKKLRENNHEVILATGRTPSIFYGIDKELGFDSFVAANGRYVVYKGKEVLDQHMTIKDLDLLVKYAEKIGKDIGFEGKDKYVLQSALEDHYKGFSDSFHLHYPEVCKDYYLSNPVYQAILFGLNEKIDELRSLFPHLAFHISNEHGIDVNQSDGMKDVGLKAIVEYLGIPIEDTNAVGDGNNDVSMIQYAHLGIAMGNSYTCLKEAADMVTDDIDQDGFYNVFQKLGLI